MSNAVDGRKYEVKEAKMKKVGSVTCIYAFLLLFFMQGITPALLLGEELLPTLMVFTDATRIERTDYFVEATYDEGVFSLYLRHVSRRSVQYLTADQREAKTSLSRSRSNWERYKVETHLSGDAFYVKTAHGTYLKDLGHSVIQVMEKSQASLFTLSHEYCHQMCEAGLEISDIDGVPQPFILKKPRPVYDASVLLSAIRSAEFHSTLNFDLLRFVTESCFEHPNGYYFRLHNEKKYLTAEHGMWVLTDNPRTLFTQKKRRRESQATSEARGTTAPNVVTVLDIRKFLNKITAFSKKNIDFSALFYGSDWISLQSLSDLGNRLLEYNRIKNPTDLNSYYWLHDEGYHKLKPKGLDEIIQAMKEANIASTNEAVLTGIERLVVHLHYFFFVDQSHRAIQHISYQSLDSDGNIQAHITSIILRKTSIQKGEILLVDSTGSDYTTHQIHNYLGEHDFHADWSRILWIQNVTREGKKLCRQADQMSCSTISLMDAMFLHKSPDFFDQLTDKIREKHASNYRIYSSENGRFHTPGRGVLQIDLSYFPAAFVAPTQSFTELVAYQDATHNEYDPTGDIERARYVESRRTTNGLALKRFFVFMIYLNLHIILQHDQYDFFLRGI